MVTALKIVFYICAHLVKDTAKLMYFPNSYTCMTLKVSFESKVI